MPRFVARSLPATPPVLSFDFSDFQIVVVHARQSRKDRLGRAPGVLTHIGQFYFRNPVIVAEKGSRQSNKAQSHE